jgi:hypothetical protein
VIGRDVSAPAAGAARPGPGGAGAGTAGGVNLLGGSPSSFNGTTGSWIGLGGNVTWVRSPATTAAGALEASAASAQAMWMWSGSSQSGGLVRAAPGTVYRATASVQSTGVPVLVQPVVGFFDAAGSYLASVWGQGSPVGAGSWTPLAPALGIAPAGTSFVALGLLVYSNTPGPAVFMERPALTATAAPGATRVVGPLRVAGNRVVQSNGAPVVLRGTELYGLDSSASPSTVSATAVAAAWSWGANMMRVALGEQLWLGSSCHYDPGYASAVDRAVQSITQMGMVALLELQDSSLGSGCPPGGPHDMADDPGSTQFWSQVAARYGSNPLVAFDVYNEPHDISDAVWLNGGQATEGLGTTYQAAGMQQLVTAVRATGAQNLIVVSGNNWGNTVPATLVAGTNVVYSVHAYTCPGAAPPACTDPTPTDPSRLLGQWVGVGASFPVMVGEFGWPSTADGTYVRNVIAFATAHGWGWNAFAWVANPPWGLLASTPATGPYEPSPSGMPVLAALTGAG